MRKECKAACIVDTSANLWKFYVNKCRNNLHLVLAMSPSGDKLRLRCRSFPGLISNCVIDWFFAWSVTRCGNQCFTSLIRLVAISR